MPLWRSKASICGSRPLNSINSSIGSRDPDESMDFDFVMYQVRDVGSLDRWFVGGLSFDDHHGGYFGLHT